MIKYHAIEKQQLFIDNDDLYWDRWYARCFFNVLYHNRYVKWYTKILSGRSCALT